MTAGSDAIMGSAGGGLLPLAILLPALGVLCRFSSAAGGPNGSRSA